jgi:hypothetical protein
MQVRYQMTGGEDQGLFDASLLLACQQHTTEGQRIVLALE